jgi:hypothetical protein
MHNAFLGLAAQVPDWMTRAYLIDKALKAYDQTKQQLLKQVGTAAYTLLEAGIAAELAQEYAVEALTHDKVKVIGQNGRLHYEWRRVRPDPMESKTNE